ncbi:MAG: DUF2313 domain-containing protein [Firmicutes bacterium]|nr:DUF2313 domain-containing protein [Bacillota bacterium]
MTREIHLAGYLPDILKEIYEFEQVFNAEEPELSLVFEKCGVILDECFIDTLDEYGCQRWERMLAITANDTDTLELRRLRIKTALNGDTPYTMRSLENKLKALCGEGNFILKYANDIYTLTVGLALAAKDSFDYLKRVLEEIVPANIILDIFLMYNTHETLAAFKHNALSAYKHIGLTEEVLT